MELRINGELMKVKKIITINILFFHSLIRCNLKHTGLLPSEHDVY
jgi:hypothetical protein